jgi:hypothetical protein
MQTENCSSGGRTSRSDSQRRRKRAFRACVRTTIRAYQVSHLRCSELLLPPFPALAGWASFGRASGALVLAPSSWDPPVVTRDL